MTSYQSYLVFDAMAATHSIEGMSWPLTIYGQIRELDAIVGEHRMED